MGKRNGRHDCWASGFGLDGSLYGALGSESELVKNCFKVVHPYHRVTHAKNAFETFMSNFMATDTTGGPSPTIRLRFHSKP